ncbi:MAG: hypothetical protein M3Z29_08900 [Pseudomonadota bacterium]|nr:hypothetical protein [Pseudomonadota bacterium]
MTHAPSPEARRSPPRPWAGVAASVGILALLLCVSSSAGAQPQDPGAALRARHDALADKLASSPFRRPLHLESTQEADKQRGEIFVEVAYPFALIKRSMQSASQWCDILILHLNVKRCRAEAAPAQTILSVSIGKKSEESAADASKVDFVYRLADNSAQYFQVLMNAPAGPLGTRDYQIALEAVPIDADRSFLHMSYSYGYGLAARLAMQAYLGTVGADKVGFSVVGRTADGQPLLTHGVRGVVERNTMRYYLGIEAYLASLALPAEEQAARRIHDWFAATEEFALQLHELSASEYTQMKRREMQP